MRLCCLDEKNIDCVKDKIYIVFYKQNYLLSFLANQKMPRLVHILKGVELNNKYGENKNADILKLLPSDAKLVIATGDVRETFEYLSCISYVNENFKEIYFYMSKELSYEFYYRKKYQNQPLKKSIIFSSSRDRSISDDFWEYADNARALFEYMLKLGLNEVYELIWIVKEPSRYSAISEQNKNVKFISSFAAISEDADAREEYYEALCLSEFLFVSQSYSFMRNAREDQTRVQLWHGCGFKSNQLTERQEKKYEYMTVTSQMYSELHARSFGLREEQLLITGLPKNDWFFSPQNDWRAVFNIPLAEKYIFWLPTYRTCATSFKETILNPITGLPIFRDVKMLMKMNSILNQMNVVLVVKLHPSQDRENILSWKLSNIVLIENDALAKNRIDINQILGNADALISDYSSVATGFMLLNRPIAFTLDDYEVYHGFHWAKEDIRDWLPGEEIFDFDDFVHFVCEVADGKDLSREKRNRLMPYYHKYNDGHSCERVLETLGIIEN